MKCSRGGGEICPPLVPRLKIALNGQTLSQFPVWKARRANPYNQTFLQNEEESRDAHHCITQEILNLKKKLYKRSALKWKKKNNLVNN
jgi:hypothetical protein